MTAGVWIFIVVLVLTALWELIFPNQYIDFWKKATYSKYIRAWSILLFIFAYLFYLAIGATKLTPLIWIFLALALIKGLWILIHPKTIVRLGEIAFFDRLETQKYFVISLDFFARVILSALLLYAVLG
jgi:hypothetical protein